MPVLVADDQHVRSVGLFTVPVYCGQPPAGVKNRLVVRRSLCLLFVGLFVASLAGQTTILEFTWESADPTVSVVGPDAASIGNLAVTKPRLDGNTNGLAPSQTTTKQNLDLVVADDPLFDVGGIDVSLDYQRDETVYTLFRRNNFYFCNGGLNVRYRVGDGAGGSTTITSPTYAIEDDNVYRTYRFRYEPVSGIGTLYKNGAVVWNSDPTPGRNLFWGGEGNLRIGVDTDGSGRQEAVLDNFVLVGLEAALPVILESFTGRATADASVALEWTTSAEADNAYFVVERSTDGATWYPIDSVSGSGSTNERRRYRSLDAAPGVGTNYYRLRQVDYDGREHLSYAVPVVLTGPPAVRIFPNPTTGRVRITANEEGALSDISLWGPAGQRLTAAIELVRESPRQYLLDLGELPTGCYFLRMGQRHFRLCKRG